MASMSGRPARRWHLLHGRPLRNGIYLRTSHCEMASLSPSGHPFSHLPGAGRAVLATLAAARPEGHQPADRHWMVFRPRHLVGASADNRPEGGETELARSRPDQVRSARCRCLHDAEVELYRTVRAGLGHFSGLYQPFFGRRLLRLENAGTERAGPRLQDVRLCHGRRHSTRLCQGFLLQCRGRVLNRRLGIDFWGPRHDRPERPRQQSFLPPGWAIFGGSFSSELYLAPIIIIIQHAQRGEQ